MKKHWVRGLAAMALAGVLALTACVVVVTQDITVDWTIEGSDDVSACSTYGISYFTVDLLGPDRGSATIDCTDYWGVDFPSFEEGIYDVTVTAWDANDALVGSLTLTQFVDGALPSTGAFLFDFSPSDLTGVSSYCGDGTCDSNEDCSTCSDDCDICTGDAKIAVLWNINGTVDGSDTGLSWDTCAEVGATEAVVSVDGIPQTFDCSAGGNMATVLTGLTAGQGYALSIKLVDSSSTDLTSEVSATVQASVDGGQFIGDFFYDSFYEPNLTGIDGQFHFSTTYDTLTCTETTPNVDFQVTLIRTEDNEIVTNVQVCDLGNTGCYEADATDTKPCTDLEQVLSLLPWGSYKIKLDGGADIAANLELCWLYEDYILIGAGTDNPIKQLDLEGIDGASCFQ